MKPSIEASGVRNSWLALAMKSTRMRSSRRCSVRSRKVSSVAATAPGAGCERRDADFEQPLDRHALAPRRRLGFAAGQHAPHRVDDVGGAQGQDQRLAELQAGQQGERRRVGDDRAALGVDHHRRFRHRPDQPLGERRMQQFGEGRDSFGVGHADPGSVGRERRAA